MSKSGKTMTVNLKRVIAGSPAGVFDAWMDPKQACNPWNVCKDVMMQPRAGTLFYFRGPHSSGSHFGRMLTLARGRELRHTWMSFYTRGVETTVTVLFKKHAAGTLMSIRHSGLPNDAYGRSHAQGWGQFLDMTEKLFAGKKRGEAHGSRTKRQ